MQAHYVTTGGPVPDFFDAVIPVEETEFVDSTHIKITKQMSVGQFVREPGSDIAKGQIVLNKNQVLRAAELGLLATVGHISVTVFRKPIIGLLSTGNELVPASTEVLDDGKIRDSNKLMLKSILKEYQVAGEVKDYGTVSDDEDSLREKMLLACSECHMVVTSGGVSMGELDLVKPFVEKNGEVYFGRLNMKPGKPTTFGKIGRAVVFALPGNPVSAFVTAHLFVVTSARMLAG
jgi:gephyrin